MHKIKKQRCTGITYPGMLRLKLLLRCVNRIESWTSSTAPFLATHGGAFALLEWNELFCWNRTTTKFTAFCCNYHSNKILQVI